MKQRLSFVKIILLGLLLLSLVTRPAAAQPEQEPVKNVDDPPTNGTSNVRNDTELPTDDTDRPLTFGMVSGDSTFFEPVKAGWLHVCKTLNVTCHYLPVNFTYYFEEQANDYIHPCVPLMMDLVEMGVDGISAACNFEDVTPWQAAHDAGIPLVAFDSKPPEGFPIPLEAYVGTDQDLLGRTMARLLKQLKPEGGDFGIVYTPAFDDRVEGFRDEIFQDNNREDRAHWYEVDLPIRSYDSANDVDQYHWYMEMLAKKNPTAIIFMYQTPMRAENYTNFVDEHRDRGILYLGTDGSDYQLEYLNLRYVDGLVGQLPYDMGAFSAEILHKAALKRRDTATTAEKIQRDAVIHANHEIVLDAPELPLVPTNLVAYNLIPVELPPLEVDQSLLGSKVIAGYTCFGILALSCILCFGWTIVMRTGVIVKASQPAFLLMTIIGILLMASALIPLSYDDNGNPEELDDTFRVGVCMSIPWLIFTGFTCTFSALFSKTWRINKFFHSKSAFGRLKVSELDVLMPFLVLITLNFVVLICWTVIDPLRYDREFLLGTDYWNREIASVGRCESEHAAAFLVPLALLNFLSLVIAAWQAWEARDIESEFSEGKYIGLSIFSLCQAFMTGIPIIAVVKDIPEAFYLVTVFLIFMLCVVLLSLVFVPKMRLQYMYAKLTLAEQRKLLAISVRKSAFNSAIESSELSSQRMSGFAVPSSPSTHRVYEASGSLSGESSHVKACQHCGYVPTTVSLSSLHGRAGSGKKRSFTAKQKENWSGGNLKLTSSEESRVISSIASPESAISTENSSSMFCNNGNTAAPTIAEGVETNDSNHNSIAHGSQDASTEK